MEGWGEGGGREIEGRGRCGQERVREEGRACHRSLAHRDDTYESHCSSYNCKYNPKYDGSNIPVTSSAGIAFSRDKVTC